MEKMVSDLYEIADGVIARADRVGGFVGFGLVFA